LRSAQYLIKIAVKIKNVAIQNYWKQLNWFFGSSNA